MKKYIVYYTTKDSDYDKEWTMANSPEEAGENLMREHWDIVVINHVEESK